ncbi:multicopper oxidase family protein [Cystobacter ferrugineus]|uniref:multicopper oxidase family protein n=1 Tax=Cystobacter ferrugineus TaxID=83449 RepID=UPI001FE42774|nr:multicopper oxidase domain-containing protein [Cystobacter ferrugineus]
MSIRNSSLPLLGVGLMAGAAAITLPQSWPTPWPRPDEQKVSQELVVKYGTNRICRTMEQGQCKQWDDVKLRSYNGGLVGPTIEVRPGSTLSILLDNQLPLEPPLLETQLLHPTPNIPHGFNTTNIHTHGLHVSPVGNSDNVLLAIGPQKRFEYEIKIPDDHPAGLYWYHAHKHGSVALQVSSGMAGALIVRGDIDEVPAIRNARERIFVFEQIPYSLMEDPEAPGTQINMVENYDAFMPGRWEESGLRTLINGELLPTISIRPGETQRWRFIHAGTMEALRLRLVRESDQQALMTQYQIAHDGITTGRLDAVQETEMFPGYRVDVMVRAGAVQETYLLVDEASAVADSLHGQAESRKVLARVVVEGRSFGMMPLPSPAELARLVPFQPIADNEITGTQEANFDVDFSVLPPVFMINGRPYNPNDPPRRLQLEAVEEWRVSATAVQGHPFHIHVNPFLVMLGNGKDIWKDTLFIRPGQSFKLRTRYRRYIGKFVLHCHILDHEDMGMMEVEEIVPPGSMSSGEHPH